MKQQVLTLLAIVTMLAPPHGLYAQGHITATVGEPVCFTLAAMDAQGDTIRDWDQTGEWITLTLQNSTANIDTSTFSWSGDPDGYTYAIITDGDQPLEFLPPDQWMVPRENFLNGVATMCVVSTKADTGLYVVITPLNSPVHRDLDTMTFVPGETDHLLVDITWPKNVGHAVYRRRDFEVLFWAKDKYSNTTNDQMRISFDAKIRGEFFTPYYDPIEYEFWMKGSSSIIFQAFDERIAGIDELHKLKVLNQDDPSIFGWSDEFEVLPHAPDAFHLLTPADGSIIELQNYGATETFSWEASRDPYDSIQVSRFDPKLTSDVVKYVVNFYDSTDLVNRVAIDSDNLGSYPVLSITHGMLNGIAQQLEGGMAPFPKTLYWTVEATDGLYTSYTGPDPTKQTQIRTITLNLPVIEYPPFPPPETFALHRVFPNPFSGSTTIVYNTYSDMSATISVYDLLGHNVLTIYPEPSLSPESKTLLSGMGLAPGVYQVVLRQGEYVASKIVMKVR